MGAHVPLAQLVQQLTCGAVVAEERARFLRHLAVLLLLLRQRGLRLPHPAVALLLGLFAPRAELLLHLPHPGVGRE